jgi:hypothetical protein
MKSLVFTISILIALSFSGCSQERIEPQSSQEVPKDLTTLLSQKGKELTFNLIESDSNFSRAPRTLVSRSFHHDSEQELLLSVGNADSRLYVETHMSRGFLFNFPIESVFLQNPEPTKEGWLIAQNHAGGFSLDYILKVKVEE